MMSRTPDPFPPDEVVRDAVASTGDPELASLTASPSSYVLRPAEVQGEHTRLFNVVLLEVPHAMGFLLAIDDATGIAIVTSGQPDSVCRLIASDPVLAEPSTVWSLIRGAGVDGQLIDAALVDHHYEFRIRDRDTGDIERWVLSLSHAGCTWERLD